GAGLLSLLRPWADLRGLEVAVMSPQEACKYLSVKGDCRLLIFSLGAATIAKGENAAKVAALHALAPSIPLVIFADSADPQEVAAALRSGAEGFVPGEMRPELALQALSFILSGGCYFPSAA